MKELLEILLKAYVELNRLHAQPGDKCHMLATSIHHVEKWINRILKGDWNE